MRVLKKLENAKLVYLAPQNLRLVASDVEELLRLNISHPEAPRISHIIMINITPFSLIKKLINYCAEIEIGVIVIGNPKINKSSMEIPELTIFDAWEDVKDLLPTNSHLFYNTIVDKIVLPDLRINLNTTLVIMSGDDDSQRILSLLSPGHL